MRRRLRVAYVDDEPILTRVVTRRLSSEHDVKSTTCGAELLKWIDDGELFDVLVIDLMMPELSGMDLHAELQARGGDLARRAVFMTGGAFTPEASAFLARHPLVVLEKPFHLDDLLRAIHDVAG